MDCIFCKIIAKQIPSKIVFENDEVLAFRDITPQAPVHILIIPKKHIDGLNDVTPQDAAVLASIQLIARDIAAQEHISADGYRLVVNCGSNAGQAVAHLHVHLLGGRKFSWPPG